MEPIKNKPWENKINYEYPIHDKKSEVSSSNTSVFSFKESKNYSHNNKFSKKSDH